jgi:hypothetical protein
MYFKKIQDAIAKISLVDITNVELSVVVREQSSQQNSKYPALNSKISLHHSLMVAYAIKEAYRLGVIRGQVLRK